MLEKLNDLPSGVDGVKAVGRISKEDYEQVMVPLMDAAREDAKIGLRYLRLFEGWAIASVAPKLAEHFVKAEVKAFSYEDLDGAIAWARGGLTTA